MRARRGTHASPSRLAQPVTGRRQPAAPEASSAGQRDADGWRASTRGQRRGGCLDRARASQTPPPRLSQWRSHSPRSAAKRCQHADRRAPRSLSCPECQARCQRVTTRAAVPLLDADGCRRPLACPPSRASPRPLVARAPRVALQHDALHVCPGDAEHLSVDQGVIAPLHVARPSRAIRQIFHAATDGPDRRNSANASRPAPLSFGAQRSGPRRWRSRCFIASRRKSGGRHRER
jgi:hypothetical protein